MPAEAATTSPGRVDHRLRRRLLTLAAPVAVALAGDLLIYFATKDSATNVTAVAVIVCSCLALLARRRRPIPVFALVWLIAVGTWVFADMQTTVAPLIMIYTVAELFALRIGVGGLVVMFAAFVIRSLAFRFDALSLAFGLTFYGVLALAAWVVGRFRRRGRTQVARLRREHERATEEAVRDERLRLSRELHDIVSHTVNVMTLQAAGARAVMSSSPQQAAAALDVIERSGVQAMNELHRLLQLLRSPEHEEESLTVQPRLSDLPDLIDLARQSGQSVRLDLDGPAGELDPSVELAVFRIVQESLTNARKYAGRDAEVSVHLEWLPPQLVVTVANAPGDTLGDTQLAALSTGHGLVGLSERIQLIGGELETGPTETGGYRVRAVLPVAAMRLASDQAADLSPAQTQAWGSFDE